MESQEIHKARAHQASAHNAVWCIRGAPVCLCHIPSGGRQVSTILPLLALLALRTLSSNAAFSVSCCVNKLHFCQYSKGEGQRGDTVDS